MDVADQCSLHAMPILIKRKPMNSNAPPFRKRRRKANNRAGVGNHAGNTHHNCGNSEFTKPRQKGVKSGNARELGLYPTLTIGGDGG